MRIHTDTLTMTDIYKAAQFARVHVVKLEEKGSRSRARAFDVKLEGESRRRPNGGSSGVAYGSGYAATWDQWGVFLSVLYDLDNGNTFEPSAPLVTPYYDDRADFHRRTAERFLAAGIVGTGHSSNANVINVRNDDGVIVNRIAGSYWPVDAHGDHTFRWNGLATSCTKCSARQSH